MNEYIIFVLLLIILYIICIISYLEYFDCNIIWNSQNKKKHIIVTRFNEENILEELLKNYINKDNTNIFIYNKGKKNIILPDEIKNVEVINIDNIGWDAYGFIDHVIKNYDNLPDYIYNIHASSIYLQHKCDTSKDILNKNTDNVYYYGGAVGNAPTNFRLLDWSATTDINKSNGKYVTASVYPLGKWLESKIDKIPDYGKSGDQYVKVNYFGMFLVHKSRILRYPKSFYENLLNEISVWQSEVNHYLERSWYGFYSE
jgi:hypothetical protein